MTSLPKHYHRSVLTTLGLDPLMSNVYAISTLYKQYNTSNFSYTLWFWSKKHKVDQKGVMPNHFF